MIREVNINNKTFEDYSGAAGEVPMQNTTIQKSQTIPQSDKNFVKSKITLAKKGF